MRNSLLFGLILTIAWSISSCTDTKKQQRLPYIGQHSTVEKTVDGKTITDTSYYQVPEFRLLNQDSTYIASEDFDNKIYVTNFFFTHCPSICPTMQRNLLQVYEKYKEDDRVAFLSHSIDFKYDSPNVLKTYAEKLGVTNDHWQFVTGSKKDIYSMADHYYVYTKEEASAPGGYDHQAYLVLIDGNRHIRGAYDGTNDEQVKQLFSDLAILLEEK